MTFPRGRSCPVGKRILSLVFVNVPVMGHICVWSPLLLVLPNTLSWQQQLYKPSASSPAVGIFICTAPISFFSSGFSRFLTSASFCLVAKQQIKKWWTQLFGVYGRNCRTIYSVCSYKYGYMLVQCIHVCGCACIYTCAYTHAHTVWCIFIHLK